jgi:biotin carboxyl carrier protein
MPTSRKLLQQARRAVLAAFVLGGFASLLQLTLPLYVLHAVETAIPAAGLGTLGLLALLAASTAATWTCIAAARDRILLRAGLWLGHTLGRHVLEEGERLGMPSAEIEKNMEALAAFTGALAERDFVLALDAAWLALPVVVLGLLHPVMGEVAASCAALLVVASLAQARPLGRLSQLVAEARKGAATWWLATTLAPSLPAGAAGEWEQLDRAYIAGACALRKRQALLRDVSGLLRVGAQVALVAVGAWLVIAQELTPAALLACVLINASMLAVLERLIGSLPQLHAAMAAHRRLTNLASRSTGRRTPSQPPTATAHAGRTPPRLNVRGPLALGLIAVLLFMAAVSGAAVTRLGDLVALTGGAIFDTGLTVVASPSGGITARVHVREGAEVWAGDVIVTLDTAALDRQIAALKAQAETAKRQLALVRRDASGLVAPVAAVPTDRPVLASLEQRTGELEQEAQWLLSRIAAAEAELAGSEVRAPASGRVVALGVRSVDATARCSTGCSSLWCVVPSRAADADAARWRPFCPLSISRLLQPHCLLESYIL